jgi:dethiobiotin synthetase
MRPSTSASKRIIFITGTDTGVGKTVLTALLLHHLRAGQGVPPTHKLSAKFQPPNSPPRPLIALAIKPFCSGSRADVRLLQSFQPGELTDDEANPFYFREPVAPLVALRKLRRKIALKEVFQHIESVKKRCDCLLIEGSGGLLVPLAETFTVADLIAQLNAQNTTFQVIVVARNRLGTINHTLLTVRHLQSIGITVLAIALISQKKPDFPGASNPKILAEMLRPIPVVLVPFLGSNVSRAEALKNNYKKVKKTLARLLELGNL